jgi:hypothetical protein
VMPFGLIKRIIVVEIWIQDGHNATAATRLCIKNLGVACHLKVLITTNEFCYLDCRHIGLFCLCNRNLGTALYLDALITTYKPLLCCTSAD